jgi:hypothetical protein
MVEPEAGVLIVSPAKMSAPLFWPSRTFPIFMSARDDGPAAMTTAEATNKARNGCFIRPTTIFSDPYGIRLTH